MAAQALGWRRGGDGRAGRGRAGRPSARPPSCWACATAPASAFCSAASPGCGSAAAKPDQGPPGRIRSAYRRRSDRLLALIGHGRWGSAIIFLSGATGLPPVFAVQFLVPATKMPVWLFAVALFLGRCDVVPGGGVRSERDHRQAVLVRRKKRTWARCTRRQSSSGRRPSTAGRQIGGRPGRHDPAGSLGRPRTGGVGPAGPGRPHQPIAADRRDLSPAAGGAGESRDRAAYVAAGRRLAADAGRSGRSAWPRRRQGSRPSTG